MEHSRFLTNEDLVNFKYSVEAAAVLCDAKAYNLSDEGLTDKRYSFPHESVFAEKSFIPPWSVVRGHCILKDGVKVGKGTTFLGPVLAGYGCHFMEGCSFGSDSSFKSGSVFESGCTFMDDNEFGERTRFRFDCVFRNRNKFGANTVFDGTPELGHHCEISKDCVISGRLFKDSPEKYVIFDLPSPRLQKLIFFNLSGSVHVKTFEATDPDKKCMFYSGNVPEFRRRLNNSWTVKKDLRKIYDHMIEIAILTLGLTETEWKELEESNVRSC